MGIFRSVLVLLAGAALATFLWSNYEQTVVICLLKDRYCTVPTSLSAALVGAIAAGFLLAVILSLPNQFRLRRLARELRRKNEHLEEEIAELRKLPLTDVSDPPISGLGERGLDPSGNLSGN